MVGMSRYKLAAASVRWLFGTMRQLQKVEQMKRLSLMSLLAAVALTTACSSMPGSARKAEPEVSAQPATPAEPHAAGSAERVSIHDAGGSVVVQKVKFRVGVSSTTVERLAKRFGCTGSPGAGLVTEEGPVEVYRMQCDNGTTFVAECELRQCRPMR